MANFLAFILRTNCPVPVCTHFLLTTWLWSVAAKFLIPRTLIQALILSANWLVTVWTSFLFTTWLRSVTAKFVIARTLIRTFILSANWPVPVRTLLLLPIAAWLWSVAAKFLIARTLIRTFFLRANWLVPVLTPLPFPAGLGSVTAKLLVTLPRFTWSPRSSSRSASVSARLGTTFSARRLSSLPYWLRPISTCRLATVSTSSSD